MATPASLPMLMIRPNRRACIPGSTGALRRARGRTRGRAGATVCCGVALALDVSQAFGELAISDPDNVHATHVPVCPVVAPAHDGASKAVRELLLDGKPGLGRRRQHLSPDPAHRVPAFVAGAVRWRRG